MSTTNKVVCLKDKNLRNLKPNTKNVSGLSPHMRIPNLMFNALSDGGQTSVSTDGWDTVYAMTTDAANIALQTSYNTGTAVRGITNYTSSYGSLNCVFNPFTIASSGSEAYVHMMAPVTSGTFVMTTPALNKDLTGGSFKLEVRFAFLNAGGNTQNMVTDTKDIMCIAVEGVTGLDTVQTSILRGFVEDYLNQPAQKTLLAQVFASININPQLVNDGSDWLRPVAVNYSFYSDSLETNRFLAILSLTGDPTTVSQRLQFLTQQVSPGLIPANGTARAGFLISDELFLTKVILPEVTKQYSSVGNDAGMTYSSDTVSISNGNQFVIDTVKPAAITYNMTVAPGDFQLLLQGGQLVNNLKARIDISPGITCYMTSNTTYNLTINQTTQTWTLTQASSSTDHYTEIATWVIVTETIAGIISAAIGAGIGAVTKSILKAVIAVVIAAILVVIPQFIQAAGEIAVTSEEKKFSIFSNGVYSMTWNGSSAFNFSSAYIVKGFLLGGSVILQTGEP